MKKLLSVLLVIFLTASITACTSNEGSAVEGKSASTSQKVEKQSFGLNEAVTLKDLKITALKIEESNGIEFLEAEDGKIFVGVNFEVENMSEETQSVSSLLQFDAYADDTKCEYSFTANVAFGDGTLDGEIAPGKKLVGWYAVEVSQDWKQLELEFKADLLSDKKAKFIFVK